MCHKRPTNAIPFSTRFPSMAPVLARIARESSAGSAKMSLMVLAMTHMLILQLESTSEAGGDATAYPASSEDQLRSKNCSISDADETLQLSP